MEDAADDDVLVLPWWYSWWRVALLTTLVLVAVGAGITAAVVKKDPLREDGVDLGFLRDMSVHHGQAIEIGYIYLDLEGTDPDLRTIALGIVKNQTFEVGAMSQLTVDLGASLVSSIDEPEDEEGIGMGWMGAPVPYSRMPGMATEADLTQLRSSSGAEADRIFVALMTAHHRGGVDMAEYAEQHAKRAKIRAIGSAIAGAQKGEIVTMQQVLG